MQEDYKFCVNGETNQRPHDHVIFNKRLCLGQKKKNQLRKAKFLSHKKHNATIFEERWQRVPPLFRSRIDSKYEESEKGFGNYEQEEIYDIDNKREQRIKKVIINCLSRKTKNMNLDLDYPKERLEEKQYS